MLLHCRIFVKKRGASEFENWEQMESEWTKDKTLIVENLKAGQRASEGRGWRHYRLSVPS